MNVHTAGVATNVTEKSQRLAAEAAQWVSGNLVGILIAAALGVLLVLAMLAIRTLGCRLISRWGGDPHWPVIFARVLSRTKLYFMIAAAAELVAEHAFTPPTLMSVIHAAFVIAFAIQAAIWARELVLGYVEHRVGASDEHSTLSSAVGIIRLLVTIALFAIAIILILDNLGVNVTGLVAGLGIGGIAIGLAAQGIFSDLFAALSILFDKPFRRGEGIRFGEVNGTVENIGLKTTRIRSLSGEQIVVANAKLLEQQIHNFAHLEHRRIVLPLGLVCQTPSDVCARLPAMLKEIVEAQPKASLVRAGMTGFGASTLDFELQFDVHSTDYEEVYRTRSAVCIAILDRFNREDVQLAYPSQTTFTAAPDGSLIMPYPPVRLVAQEDEGADRPEQPDKPAPG
ncbi:MAG: mechanosensitive ion channel family protein [Alphaproteobacteria bacterium]|nr:mechanosensitive ion channel family protein [Alphaproteobacteria bacterium]MBV9370754.1 mechanosensitive ion channel family protein [Alphaproteobacteria bacterium]MBV9899827.1 mechanosensitive ion channel family protein [Alphaproteobacteria bacterium]